MRELLERVHGIITVVQQEENWLPVALRALLTTTYLELKQRQRYAGLPLAQARKAISSLALDCYLYDDLTASSRALRLVRVLDMELSWQAFRSRSEHPGSPDGPRLP